MFSEPTVRSPNILTSRVVVMFKFICQSSIPIPYGSLLFAAHHPTQFVDVVQESPDMFGSKIYIFSCVLSNPYYFFYFIVNINENLSQNLAILIGRRG